MHFNHAINNPIILDSESLNIIENGVIEYAQTWCYSEVLSTDYFILTIRIK